MLWQGAYTRVHTYKQNTLKTFISLIFLVASQRPKVNLITEDTMHFITGFEAFELDLIKTSFKVPESTVQASDEGMQPTVLASCDAYGLKR